MHRIAAKPVTNSSGLEMQQNSSMASLQNVSDFRDVISKVLVLK